MCADVYIRSNIKVEGAGSFIFVWTVPFSAIRDANDLYSPVFDSLDNKHSWQIKLQPNTKDVNRNDGEEYLGLFLCCCSGGNLIVRFEATIQDQSHIGQSFQREEPKFHEIGVGKGLGWRTFINNKLLVPLVRNDTIKFYVQIWVKGKWEHEKLKLLVSEGSEAKKVPSRSPVLMENYSSNDKDVKALLEFLDTGKTNGLYERLKLYKVAKHYDVPGIKAKCELEILKGVNADNAVELYVFATIQKSETLKSKVTEFIKREKRSVRESEAYIKARFEDPEIFEKLLDEIGV